LIFLAAGNKDCRHDASEDQDQCMNPNMKLHGNGETP
jgi:hypothetical protein